MSLAESYVNSIGMEFVLIPAGEFIMGAADLEKERKVRTNHEGKNSTHI